MRDLAGFEIEVVSGGDTNPAPTCTPKTENDTTWMECSCPEGYSIDYEDNFGEIVIRCTPE